MHTVDAAETIGRMVEFFPTPKQPLIRSILAGVLRGVVSQRLLPKIEGGRVAAVEVMIMNDRIGDLIRENRAGDISAAIAEGAYYEMQTFSQALINLVLDGVIEYEVAANAAPNRHDFTIALDYAEKARAAFTGSPGPAERPEPEPEPEPAVEEPPPSVAPLRLLRAEGQDPPPVA